MPDPFFKNEPVDFCQQISRATQILAKNLPDERQVVLYARAGDETIRVDRIESAAPDLVYFIREDHGLEEPEAIVICHVAAVNVLLTSQPVSRKEDRRGPIGFAQRTSSS